MTLDEADQIIAELNIVFPTKKLTVEEVHRWEGNLEQFDFKIAREAIRSLEFTEHFWPSWAKFYEHYKTIYHNRTVETPMLQLEAPPMSEEDKRLCAIEIEKIKEQIKAFTNRTAI